MNVLAVKVGVIIRDLGIAAAGSPGNFNFGMVHQNAKGFAAHVTGGSVNSDFNHRSLALGKLVKGVVRKLVTPTRFELVLPG